MPELDEQQPQRRELPADPRAERLRAARTIQFVGQEVCKTAWHDLRDARCGDSRSFSIIEFISLSSVQPPCPTILMHDLDQIIRERRSVRGFLLTGRCRAACCDEVSRAGPAGALELQRAAVACLHRQRAGARPAAGRLVPGRSRRPDARRRRCPRHLRGRVSPAAGRLAVTMYREMGIARDDYEGRMRATLRNFEFFDAPHVAIVCMQKKFGVRVALDVGAYVQTLAPGALVARRGQLRPGQPEQLPDDHSPRAVDPRRSADPVRHLVRLRRSRGAGQSHAARRADPVTANVTFRRRRDPAVNPRPQAVMPATSSRALPKFESNVLNSACTRGGHSRARNSPLRPA